MVKTCPVLGSAYQVVLLLCLKELGDYTHSEEKIQKFIHKNFEQMRGSLPLSVSELLSCKLIGYSASEKALRQEGKSWMLDSLMILDPRHWDFRGTRDGIQDIQYQHNQTIYIPYDRVLHLVNRRDLAFGDPYGVSDLTLADAAWQAWKIIVAEMLVAGKRQATPLVVGYADPETSIGATGELGNQLYEEDGITPQLISSAQYLSDQLSDIENRSTLVVGLTDKIEALNQQTDGAFFFQALTYLHKILLMAFLVPETALEVVSGTGDSNLNSGHMATLHLNIEQVMGQIKEVLIEDLVRPLIEYEFGPQEDYGEFKVEVAEGVDKIQLLGALVQAVNGGVFSTQDLELINRARQLAGLPELDKLLPEAPPPEVQSLQLNKYFDAEYTVLYAASNTKKAKNCKHLACSGPFGVRCLPADGKCQGKATEKTKAAFDSIKAAILGLKDKLLGGGKPKEVQKGGLPEGVKRSMKGKTLTYSFREEGKKVEIFFKEKMSGESEIDFKVGGSYDNSKMSAEAKAKVGRKLVSVLKYDASTRPEGHPYGCAAYTKDGEGKKRALAYQAMGFSRPAGGVAGQGQFGTVKNGKVVPDEAALKREDNEYIADKVYKRLVKESPGIDPESAEGEKLLKSFEPEVEQEIKQNIERMDSWRKSRKKKK